MIIINEEEISGYTHNMFFDYSDSIMGRHSPLDGEKAFVLCILEQIAGLLSRDNKDDKMIIQHTNNLLCVANESMSEYTNYLKIFAPNDVIRRKAIELPRLTHSERNILKELMESNRNEYLMKSDYQGCCYSAMIAFIHTAYCILNKGIDININKIDITVDIYDTLQVIKMKQCIKPDEIIIVVWHSTNKINNLYMLYKTQYCGLTDSSILDLVSADVIEEDYYLSDERFTIAPSILMKQYLSIIEREVNEIIQLSKLEKTPKNHLNWYDMKNFVRRRGICIDFLPFKLHAALDDLYLYRNNSMHGETDVTNKDYEILQKYKNRGLFQGLSIKKLELNNVKIHPTVDEIGNYFNISVDSV